MLDPVGRRETVDTIRTLNEKFGITVILITHHMDEAAQAQRLIVMADGHIIDDGAPQRCFSMWTRCAMRLGRAGDGGPSVRTAQGGVKRPPRRHQ